MKAAKKFRAALAVVAALVILSVPARAVEAAARTAAKSAVVLDACSGQVLYARNEHACLPIASTTKILTALIALESSKLDDVVVVSERATKVEGSSLGLKPGERITMDALLTALLLKSANDSSLVIAEHVGGSIEGFATRMNERARELGAKNSHFANPNGLYDPNHYSSAYDLARIAREAMKQPRFRELVATKVTDIRRPDLNLIEPMINHNKLLWRDASVDGVKTGFVKESGHCLVTSATRDHWQLIAVVLDSPDMYAESQSLLNWAFSNYRSKVLARPGDVMGQARIAYGWRRSVPAVCEFPLSVPVGPGRSGEASVRPRFQEGLCAPIQLGQRVGTAELVVAGKVVATSPLVAGKAVAKSYLMVTLAWMLRGAGILVGVALVIRVNAKIIKARRRRRRRLPAQGGRPGARGTGPR